MAFSHGRRVLRHAFAERRWQLDLYADPALSNGLAERRGDGRVHLHRQRPGRRNRYGGADHHHRGSNDAPVITSNARRRRGRGDREFRADGHRHTDVQRRGRRGHCHLERFGNRQLWRDLDQPATGQWTYTLDARAEALTDGETATETFTATVTDDAGATATQTITIALTGTNDLPSGPRAPAPSRARSRKQASGRRARDRTLTATGTLAATDADAGETAA